MKHLFLWSAICLLVLSAFQCNKQSATGALRGKLVRKGLCMNYTISVVGGYIDSSKVERAWIDPQTNTTFKNVFRLDSRCSFPANLEEGDEFDFVIDDKASQDCAVCMAYYPTPQKGLLIKVVRPQ